MAHNPSDDATELIALREQKATETRLFIVAIVWQKSARSKLFDELRTDTTTWRAKSRLEEKYGIDLKTGLWAIAYDDGSKSCTQGDPVLCAKALEVLTR